MNYSTAVFLINKNVRAVMCTYEADETGKPPAKREMFKTLDPSIKVNDLVVVPTNTRHHMTVTKVVEVDVEIDFDSTVPVDWLVARVDRAPYDTVLAQEAQAITAIHSAERTRKRNELRDAMLADSAEALKALPITVLNGDTPVLPPAQS